jgi:Protein of unknown function (DUF3810)
MKEGTIKRRDLILLIFLGVLALSIRIFSVRADWVELYYSTGIYPGIGSVMRSIFGWLPFSLGDFVYLSAGLGLAFLILRLIKRLVQKGLNRKKILPLVLKVLNLSLAIYIYFNLFWGLNYNRLGISHQMQLEVSEQPVSKLNALASRLLEKTNAYSSAAGQIRRIPVEKIFSVSVSNYQKLSLDYPFLAYSPRSVKTSVFGVIGNYLGYTGYYNPFTAEAQINDAVPRFLQPFVASHEIAHQLGYAKENEANFVGFLAARVSVDTAFLYSAYFDMFLYANSELYRMDSLAARGNLKKLVPSVQRDLAELRAYRIKYENPLDKLISIFYDRYLRMNQQPDGEKTYSKVVIWLLAYYDKFGEI